MAMPRCLSIARLACLHMGAWSTTGLYLPLGLDSHAAETARPLMLNHHYKSVFWRQTKVQCKQVLVHVDGSPTSSRHVWVCGVPGCECNVIRCKSKDDCGNLFASVLLWMTCWASHVSISTIMCSFVANCLLRPAVPAGLCCKSLPPQAQLLCKLVPLAY